MVQENNGKHTTQILKNGTQYSQEPSQQHQPKTQQHLLTSMVVKRFVVG